MVIAWAGHTYTSYWQPHMLTGEHERRLFRAQQKAKHKTTPQTKSTLGDIKYSYAEATADQG